MKETINLNVGTNETKPQLSQIVGRTITISTCDVGSLTVEDTQYGSVEVRGFEPEPFSIVRKHHPDYSGHITHIVLVGGCNMAPAQCVIVSLDNKNFVVCTTAYRNHTVEECPLVFATGGGLSKLQSLISGILFHADIDNDETSKAFFNVRDFKTTDNFELVTDSAIKYAESEGITRTDCLIARVIAIGYMRDKYNEPNDVNGVGATQ